MEEHSKLINLRMFTAFSTSELRNIQKQAGAELFQAQLKLGPTQSESGKRAGLKQNKLLHS